LISNYFSDSVSGPEKAGVGGSIPSWPPIISTIEVLGPVIITASVAPPDVTEILR